MRFWIWDFGFRIRLPVSRSRIEDPMSKIRPPGRCEFRYARYSAEDIGFIEPSCLGTTDECGFSPFGDYASTSRNGVREDPRVHRGNEMASEEIEI
jgi:hypothetical protein